MFTYPGAVARWKLNETEGDITHESISGAGDVVMGSPLWQSTGGKVDGALELDGVDDYVICSFELDPADGPFSVFAWTKGGAAGQAILSQENGDNWLMADAVGNLMTELGSSFTGRVAVPPLSSQTLIVDGDWHRIGFVWDGASRILYVDDAEVARDVQAGLGPSESGLYIGTGSAMQPGTFFSGLIDDLRIYNVGLSAEQVAALAQ